MRVKNMICILLLGACSVAWSDAKTSIEPFRSANYGDFVARIDSLVISHVKNNSLVSPEYKFHPAENPSNYLRLYNSISDKGGYSSDPGTLYKLTHAGANYIAAVASYNPMLVAEPHCQSNDSALPDAHCDQLSKRRLICHLFLFDPLARNIETVIPLNIIRDPRKMPGQIGRRYSDSYPAGPTDPRQIEGWPRCVNILAVAPSRLTPNSLLFTLGYDDSAAPESKYDDESALKTTIFLSFKSGVDGKISVLQDDRCLRNPNKYGTISEARKALRTCN